MTKPAGYLTNSLTGLQGEAGVFYDYILAENGLYLRAKNDHLAATVCIAPAEVRGLAPVEESIELLHGKIPMRFIDLIVSVFCVNADREQYIAVAWENGTYNLRIPPQTQGAAAVTYETVPNTVLSIHSHGGMNAFFSGTDDRDEQGLGLYAVVGELHNLCATIELRLGCYGYFIHLEKEEVFQ